MRVLRGLLTVSLVATTLTIGNVAVVTSASAAETHSVCGVGCDFTSIQAAVNAAAHGDTINVGAGTYTENVTIGKPLTLLGVQAGNSPATSADNLPRRWGSESGWAIVKAASGSVISLTAAADGTVIKGLAITSTIGTVTPSAYGPTGINLLGPDNITIQNNYFYDLYNVAVSSMGAPATPRATGYLIDSNLIANAKGPYDSIGSYYATEVSGVSPWRVDNLTVSNNRIFGYGRGVQLDQNSGAVVRSNYISNIYAHGIQAANGQTNTLIEGNTVDRAQMAAWYDYYYGAYCSGAIRLWPDAASSGMVAKNNLITNTGATDLLNGGDGDYRDLCPAIRIEGPFNTAVASITNNSISNAANDPGTVNPGVGILWTATQITSAAVSGGTATVKTRGANSLATGDVVTISNLGPTFDGSRTVTKVGTRTLTFPVSAASVARGEAAGGGYNAQNEPTAILPGATIVRTSGVSQVGAISATSNWWGSAAGPGAAGSTINAGGASITSSPFISSFKNDPGKAGQPGFWPIILKSAQTITFTTVGSHPATDTLELSAFSTSELDVDFIISGSEDICTVSGSTLTPLKGGTCKITAHQAGDSAFNAASISRSIVIARVAQTIGFSPTSMSANATQLLTATKRDGSAIVTFTENSAACSISRVGDVFTLEALAAGTCEITASQAEDNIYAATSVKKSIAITKGAQATLTVTNSNELHIAKGLTGITLAATGGTGSGIVTYTVTGSGCTFSKTSGVLSVSTRTRGIISCSVVATRAGTGGNLAVKSAPKIFSFQ